MRRFMIQAAAFVALLVLAVLPVASCSSSQVHVESVTVDAIARAARAAQPQVLAEYEREGHAAITSACCSQAAMEAALAGVDRRWSVVIASWELTRVAGNRLRDLLMACQTDPSALDGGICTMPGFAEASADFMADLTDARCSLRAIGRADLDHVPGGPPACPLPDGGAL